MKSLATLLAAPFAAWAPATAQPVIIYQPPPIIVVSPLTSATAQSNQTLLNQINGTITQRRVEHDILTTNAAIRAAPLHLTTPRR